MLEVQQFITKTVKISRSILILKFRKYFSYVQQQYS